MQRKQVGRRAFHRTANAAQIQEFITTFNNLSQKCFDACVNDFKSPSINNKEVGVCDCWERLLIAADQLHWELRAEVHEGVGADRDALCGAAGRGAGPAGANGQVALLARGQHRHNTNSSHSLPVSSCKRR